MEINLKNLKVNRTSQAYRRAKMAGFTIGEAEIVADMMGAILRVGFKCVCGTQEYFQKMIDQQQAKHLKNISYFANGWDVAQELEDFGSFSEKHLRADGFSEEAIKEIRYIYDLEDELKMLRRMKSQYEGTMGFYPFVLPCIGETP